MLVAMLNPSILSGVYLLMLLILLLSMISRRKIIHGVYKTFFVINFFLMAVKITLLVSFYLDVLTPQMMSRYSMVFPLIGFNCVDRNRLDMDAFLAIFPELLGFISCTVGWIYSYRTQEEKLRAGLRSDGPSFVICFFLCILACISYLTVFNFVYGTIAIAWGVRWGFNRKDSSLKTGTVVLEITSSIQCVWSYMYWVFFTSYIPEITAYQYGLMSLKQLVNTPYFFFVIGLYSMSLHLNRRELYQSRVTIVGLNEGLLEKNESKVLLADDKANSDNGEVEESILTILKYDLVVLLSRIFLFITIFQYFNEVNLVVMICIFISILFKEYDFVLTKYIIIPLLLSNLLIYYTVNLFKIELEGLLEHALFKYTDIEFGVIFFTILTLLYLAHLHPPLANRKTSSDSLFSLLTIIASKHLSKISISVLFLIGLSKINLLHTGLVVLSFFFMLRSQFAKKYWVILRVYTMCMLFLQYL